MQSWERDKVPYLLSWAVTIMRHRAPRMVLAASALELDAFTPGPSATVRDGNRLRRLMREQSRGRCRAPEAAVAWSRPLSCAAPGGSTGKGARSPLEIPRIFVGRSAGQSVAMLCGAEGHRTHWAPSPSATVKRGRGAWCAPENVAAGERAGGIHSLRFRLRTRVLASGGCASGGNAAPAVVPWGGRLEQQRTRGRKDASRVIPRVGGSTPGLPLPRSVVAWVVWPWALPQRCRKRAAAC
jgi:hypothetical protein